MQGANFGPLSLVELLTALLSVTVAATLTPGWEPWQPSH